MSAPLLELRGVRLAFGGVRALHDLDLHLTSGEIAGVIGPNGAGKTTMFDVITALRRPDGGDVRLDGRPILGLAPHRVATLGIARTFQAIRLFGSMTVRENVMAATYGHTSSRPWQSLLRTPHARREERDVAARADAALAFFGDRLTLQAARPAAALSYADRRRLEIARAIVGGPRVLLLDEPTAGMNPHETARLAEAIGRLRDERGCAVLVIEHDMAVVRGVCDRVVALDHGEKVAEGAYDAVARDPAVVEAYLGRAPA